MAVTQNFAEALLRKAHSRSEWPVAQRKMRRLENILLVASAVGVPLLPADGAVDAQSSLPSWCSQEANGDPLDVSGFCDYGSGCWPALYVLGVQKAATTSVVNAMLQCGVVALGSPSSDHAGEIPQCLQANNPCKEPLHYPIDLYDGGDRELFTSLYDTSRCGSIEGHTVSPFDGADKVPNSVSIGACEKAHFLEGTPLNVGDSPPLHTLPPSKQADMAIKRWHVTRHLVNKRGSL